MNADDLLGPDFNDRVLAVHKRDESSAILTRRTERKARRLRRAFSRVLLRRLYTTDPDRYFHSWARRAAFLFACLKERELPVEDPRVSGIFAELGFKAFQMAGPTKWGNTAQVSKMLKRAVLVAEEARAGLGTVRFANFGDNPSYLKQAFWVDLGKPLGLVRKGDDFVLKFGPEDDNLPTPATSSEAAFADIPPLNMENGEWVPVKTAARLVHNKTASLGNYRSKGTSGDDGSDGQVGIDSMKRIWRKPGPHAHTWYLKSSLQKS